MLDNIKTLRSSGFTMVELAITITVAGLLIVPVVGGMFFFYGSTVLANANSELASEAHSVLRAMTEELRVSSGVRATNTIPDPNAPTGGWTTSNASLVLIISTPALNQSNQYIIDSATGNPYHNEMVYFALGDTLYRRYLSNPDATGNTMTTSCPAASATPSCPADIAMSDNFKDMNFIFYDQDNATTTSLPDARSIKLLVSMERQMYGRTITFDNNIRITIRNSLAL